MAEPAPYPLSDSRAWRAADSRALYNVDQWGEGYFGVNSRGHLTVRPRRQADDAEIDLFELTRALEEQNLNFPVLVRFGDILQDRVGALCRAFDEAIGATRFDGGYTAVYPVKVNQQRGVIESILEGADGRAGLEAGSKPELMAVMALAPAGSVIVCNGYKDRAYVRLALLGRALGHRLYIVAEKPSEVGLVLEEAAAMDVAPLLGLRVRLASVSAGKWQNSGGEKSKFGFSASQLLEAVEALRRGGRLTALRMLHFHLGSQVANVRDIQHGMREAARYYAELRGLGAPLACVNVGGGLGVDYEGTRSRSPCSINYSLNEYALNVVRTLAEVCREHDIPQPQIISESGRALSAHHAALITRVIDVESVPDAEPAAPGAGAPAILQDLWQALENPHGRPPTECYHDAANLLGEARAAYTHGVLGLRERAYAEQLYYALCRRVRPLLQSDVRAHREILDELREKLADKYFCNFSLFQSLPDAWAIDQIFPIVPICRLNERPDRRVVIEDLTCDSDGRIDHYVDRQGVGGTLPAHSLGAGEAYWLGFFMVGAYQETLGDMHNLFGDTNAVNVALDGDGGWRVSAARRGESAADLLRYLHFDEDMLLDTYRDKLAASDLSSAQRADFMAELTAGLHGYTYVLQN